MSHIKITGEFGIVIRRHSLVEKNVSLDGVLAAVELREPFDINSDLVAFGPCFGREAQDTLTKRLISLGLVYFDDFVDFTVEVPPWCGLYASLRNLA